jgi:hypothetical protein
LAPDFLQDLVAIKARQDYDANIFNDFLNFFTFAYTPKNISTLELPRQAFGQMRCHFFSDRAR